MDSQKWEILGKHDIGRRKTKNTTQKTKKDEQPGHHQKPEVNPGTSEGNKKTNVPHEDRENQKGIP